MTVAIGTNYSAWWLFIKVGAFGDANRCESWEWLAKSSGEVQIPDQLWRCFLIFVPPLWKKHVMKSWAHLNELDTLAKPARPFRTMRTNLSRRSTISLYGNILSRNELVSHDIHIPKSSYFIKGSNQLHPQKQLRLGSQTASWQSQCPR